jgi:hypothetical protein
MEEPIPVCWHLPIEDSLDLHVFLPRGAACSPPSPPQAQPPEPPRAHRQSRMRAHSPRPQNPTTAPRDVPAVVEAYLQEARARGYREVRLIHGKGTGAARAQVIQVLRQLPYVLRAYEAPPERGGWGATVVELLPGEREEEKGHASPNPRP